MAVAKALDGLPTFKDCMRDDLRNLDTDCRRVPLEEIAAGASYEEAIAILEHHIGFDSAETAVIVKKSKIGDINILRSNLAHIVEKRVDARERYVLFALDTLSEPYEIWETKYDDGMSRFMFIGTYQQKQQMLVVVASWDGKVLWNFMHAEAKSLNKHRRGNLLYNR